MYQRRNIQFNKAIILGYAPAKKIFTEVVMHPKNYYFLCLFLIVKNKFL